MFIVSKKDMKSKGKKRKENKYSLLLMRGEVLSKLTIKMSIEDNKLGQKWLEQLRLNVIQTYNFGLKSNLSTFKKSK